MIPIKNKLIVLISANAFRLFISAIASLIIFIAIQDLYFDRIAQKYINIDFMWPMLPFVNPYFLKKILIYCNFTMLFSGLLMLFKIKWPLPTWLYLISALPIFIYHQSFYQDADFLLLIIVFLLSLTPLSAGHKTVTRWAYLQFKIIFSMVFFWRAISYLNTDWLAGRVVKLFFSEIFLADTVIHTLLNNHATLLFLSYLIITFELLFVFLPWRYPKTLILVWGYLAVYFYIISQSSMLVRFNHLPILLFCLSLCFLSTTYTNTIKTYVKEKLIIIFQSNTQVKKTPEKLSLKTTFFITLYISIQLLLPPIILCYTNHDAWVRWTNSYLPFQWAMKSEIYYVTGRYFLVDPKTNKTIIIKNIDISEQKANSKALLILRYVQVLKKEFEEKYAYEPEIYAELYKSINKRNWYPYTDPRINLVNEKFNLFKPLSWITLPPKDYYSTPTKPKQLE